MWTWDYASVIERFSGEVKNAQRRPSRPSGPRSCRPSRVCAKARGRRREDRLQQRANRLTVRGRLSNGKTVRRKTSASPPWTQLEPLPRKSTGARTGQVASPQEVSVRMAKSSRLGTQPGTTLELVNSRKTRGQAINLRVCPAIKKKEGRPNRSPQTAGGSSSTRRSPLFRHL